MYQLIVLRGIISALVGSFRWRGYEWSEDIACNCDRL